LERALSLEQTRTAPRTAADYIALASDLGSRFAATAAQRDLDRILPHAEIDLIRQSGLLAARLPAPYGIDLSLLDGTRILIELSRGDPNIAQAIGPHLAFVEKLILFGNDADQQRYFSLIAGGALITNAIAERGGKVVGEIRTRLHADGDGYRLNGRKDYTTGGLFAQYLYITGIRDDGTSLQVVVPANRDGITVVDDWDGFGQRLTASGSVLLDNVRVEADEALSGSQNVKKRNYFGASSQLHHAALDSGIALAALDDAIAYTREKARPVPEAGVEKASHDPYVLSAVGEIATIARAAVALTERAAAQLDATAAAHAAGKATDDLLAETSIAVAEAKAVANQACLSTTTMLFQVGGASASLRSLNLDRHWRNARTHTLHDPVAYKFRAIGDYLLNGNKPPINAKY
jgi:alkylation response protein AidB-like acyl-CoA dehydrogenase